MQIVLTTLRARKSWWKGGKKTKVLKKRMQNAIMSYNKQQCKYYEDRVKGLT